VTALPIADRELLVYARQPVTYRGRLIVAVIALIVGGGSALLFEYFGGMAAGQLLQILSTCVMIYCIAAGSQATSDSISKEKREGTLGLLFLTHMTSFDIAGGKLVSSVLLTFYGFMACFPVLCLLMLTGGIEGSAIFRLSLASLNTLFVAATIGLLASTFSRENKASRMVSGFLIFLFWMGIPALAGWGQYAKWPQWILVVLNCLNLSQPISNSLSDPTPFGRTYFWLPLICTHALGWVFLALTVWVLPRSWQEKGGGKKSLSLGQRWQQWCYGKSQKRLRHRARLLNRNAFFWLAARNRFKPILPNVLFFLSLAFYLFILYKGQELEIAALAPFILISSFIQAILTLGESSTRLTQEHEQGTLELLLSTPLSVKEIVRGQFLACWRQYSLIYAMHMIMAALTVILVLTTLPRDAQSYIWVLLSAAWLIFYPLEMVALIFLGMWAVVTSRNLKLASRGAMGRGIFLPAAIWSVLMMLIWAAALRFNIPYWVPGTVMAPAACLLFIGNAMFWIIYVHRNFEKRLREFAMRRYAPEEKKGLLQMLFRKRKSTPPPIISTAQALG
jgi:ABC-type transport system involved in cytochrome c biogenesis permease component